MKVLFLRDIANIGKAGEIKEVNSGFARNYLLPKQMAILADATTSMQHAQIQIKGQREAAAKLGELTALAKELEGKEITLKVRSGKEKLFGSVTSTDISSQLEKTHGLAVDRKKIDLTEPIHQLGTYEIKVKLSGELTPIIKVFVIEEMENSAE